jgi:hypothetical protein
MQFDGCQERIVQSLYDERAIVIIRRASRWDRASGPTDLPGECWLIAVFVLSGNGFGRL